MSSIPPQGALDHPVLGAQDLQGRGQLSLLVGEHVGAVHHPPVVLGVGEAGQHLGVPVAQGTLLGQGPGRGAAGIRWNQRDPGAESSRRGAKSSWRITRRVIFPPIFSL